MKVYVLGIRGEQDYDWSQPDTIVAVYIDKEEAYNTAKERLREEIYEKEVRRINGLNKTAETRGFKKRHKIAAFPEWWENHWLSHAKWEQEKDANPVLDLYNYFIEEVEFIPAS